MRSSLLLIILLCVFYAGAASAIAPGKLEGFNTSLIEKDAFLAKHSQIALVFGDQLPGKPTPPDTSSFFDPHGRWIQDSRLNNTIAIWQLFKINNNSSDTLFYLYSRTYVRWDVFEYTDGIPAFLGHAGPSVVNGETQGSPSRFSFPVVIPRGGSKTFLVYTPIEVDKRISGIELVTRHFIPRNNITSFPVYFGEGKPVPIYGMQIASEGYMNDGFRPFLGVTSQAITTFLQLFFASVFFVFCFYSLLLYIQLRKRVYIYYLIYQVLIVSPFVVLNYVRHIKGFLPSNYYILPGITHDLSYISYFLFVIEFLNLREQAPKAGRLLRYGAIGGACMSLVVAISFLTGPPALFDVLYNSTRLAAIVFGLICLIMVIGRKIPLYGYIVVASIGISVFPAIQWALYVNDPGNPLLLFPLMEGGVLLELVCFLLGLGAFTQREEREKIVLQNQLISTLWQVQRLQDENFKNIVKTQEEERSRIGRDLHDDVGAQLSTLKMLLQSLFKKESAQNDPFRDSSISLLDSAIRDMRSIITNLSPKALDEHGYLKSVEELVNKITKTEKIKFELSMHDMDRRFDKEFESSLFRITQELINNSLKYAKAKKITLNVLFTGQTVKLIYDDDGIGYDPVIRSSGHGLNNIRARISIFKGDVFIDTAVGRGFHCEINVKVPL